MDKYLQSSSTLFGSLKNAVLGNPVTREYQVGRQIASFGPGLCWRVFEGKKKSTSEEASIFVLEKKMLESFSKREREIILDVMRKGPQQMTKLKHPRILTVQHPLEDSRESLAYATEPILASLANALGRHDNIPSPVPSEIKDYELYDVEKVYGLLQIAEGIAFLHNDVQLVEGNLVPESIVITRGGQWKLAGFHFASASPTTGPQADWDPGLPALAKPELNFLAPEHVLSQSKELASDLYTFGCLLTAVYNSLKAPFDAGNSVTSYKRCIEQLSRYGSDWLRNVPHEVRDHVQLLLNIAPGVRPDANQTIKHPFFDDVAAMTLKYLDSLVQRDNMTKSQFFKNLHRVLSKLPKRVVHQRVLPHLFMEFPNHAMIPFVLPIVLLIADDCTDEEYMSLIFPELKKIFHVKEPVQVLLIFMQKMELLLKKTPHSDVRNFVLPLVFRALESSSPQIQELVLSIIPNFAKMIDYSSMKNAIIPRIKTIICKTPALAVRVNALVCIGKIVEHLDKFLMMDEVFPALTQVPSREPAVLMGILGIYKQTLANKKISLEKDYIATKAIPFLLPLAVDQGLNATQFNNFMAIIRDMLDRVEQEHRTKLEQLSKLKKEQESALEFVKAVDQSHSLKEMMSKVDNLVIGTPEKVSESFGSNTEFAKIFGGSTKVSESASQHEDLLSRSEPELKKPAPSQTSRLDSQTWTPPKAEQQQQPQQQQWKQQQQHQQVQWKQQQQQQQWKQQQQQPQQQQHPSAYRGDANHSTVRSLEPSPFLGGLLQPTQVQDKRAMNADASRTYQGNTAPVSAVNSLMAKNLGSFGTATQNMNTRGASNVRPQRPIGSSATILPSSFDNILTPELKNFRSNQQPMSIAEMQRTQQHQYHHQQQPMTGGATGMHQQQSLGMGQLYNTGVMQSQTQSITMYQTQTQHIVPITQTGVGNQQSGSYQNGGILAPLVPQNSGVSQQTMVQSQANNFLDLNDLLS